MKKILVVIVIIVVLAAIINFSKKNPNPGQKNLIQQEKTKTENVQTVNQKTDSIEDLCNYFPQTLVEKAIGRPIVKVEKVNLVDSSCNYYTSYSEKYDHTPYGDHPGGPHIVVVYDTKDFDKDRVTNEKHGTKYETEPSIKMDNFVMKNNVNKIWQVALNYGGGKYIRIKAVDDAVTGEELVKIAAAFAAK